MEDKTMKLVKKCLDDADFIWYYLAPLYSCTNHDVERVEKELGIIFPPEYIAHLTGEYPGIYIEASDEVWPKDIKGGAFWFFLHSIHTYTASDAQEDVEDEMRLIVEGKRFMQETGLHICPILKRVSDADVYCTDANGNIVQFSHEGFTTTTIEMDFWTLFEQELNELRKRKEMMVERNR